MRAKKGWLRDFAENAASTDKFIGHDRHVGFLALGLMGEAGSILAEVKKREREGAAYPALKRKLREELGDFLWYYVRLVAGLEAGLIDALSQPKRSKSDASHEEELAILLGFGAAVGDLLRAIREREKDDSGPLRDNFRRVWAELDKVSEAAQIPLREAAGANVEKRADRWPTELRQLPLFDEGYPEEEQLPRQLEIEFLERVYEGRPVVIIRSRGLNIGDRLTDNIEEGDEYRFHDVIHFGHAAFLGWSPVIRSLLRCKRKSRPSVDENEDGGRAQVIEEAISAVVFSRAKELGFFEEIDHLDYDLLKNIQELVKGYEVDAIPLWQWEKAILKSYEVFRELKAKHGGRVLMDLQQRSLDYLGSR